MKKNIEGVGEVMAPSTKKEKLQNFWYHYKWHSIVAFVVIIALLVCSLQFCGKESYDAYILYAGSKNIGRTATDGETAEISTVISSLKRVTDDFDDNGDVNINFTNYYYLSAEEAAELTDGNETLLASDKKSLSAVFEHSDYYLCFISVAVYEAYHNVGDDELFADISGYAASHPSLQYYAPNAIYLSSTDAYNLPGLSVLPEDTLICIRRPSVLGGKSKQHKKLYNNAVDILENIIALKFKN